MQFRWYLDLLSSKRLARFPIQANTTPPIMIQFAFKCVRDDFYRRYLSSRNLSLIQLGFNVNQRVYINENLTEQGRRIKNLCAVFTKDGCVYVKTAVETEPVPVN